MKSCDKQLIFGFQTKGEIYWYLFTIPLWGIIFDINIFIFTLLLYPMQLMLKIGIKIIDGWRKIK